MEVKARLVDDEMGFGIVSNCREEDAIANRAEVVD